MTQRKLTADEVKKLSNAYRELGFIRDLVGDEPMTINDVCVLLASMILSGTTDGKPLTPVERVPTAEDIGRRVKVRHNGDSEWMHGRTLVGFMSELFVTGGVGYGFAAWSYAIIDDEAGQ
jgi:hypothetical protein